MTPIRIFAAAAIVSLALPALAQSTAIRPIEGDLALSYKPVSKFSERISVDGKLADGRAIKASYAREGSIAAQGPNLLSSMTLRNTDLAKGADARLAQERKVSVVMTPLGETRSIEIAGDKGGMEQVLGMALFNTATLRPTVRQGQEAFDISNIVMYVAALQQGMRVLSNTLVARAVGVQGNNLVVEPGGGVEMEGKDKTRVKATLSGRCLVDMATALSRNCDVNAAFDYTVNGEPSTGAVRIRSVMDIKP
jgi:hypothetical protein